MRLPKLKPKAAKAKTAKKSAAKTAPRASAQTTANGTIKIAVTGNPVQTVTVTFTSKKGAVETVKKELQHGDTLSDFRVVVALVGGSHTGVIGPDRVVAETPGSTFS